MWIGRTAAIVLLASALAAAPPAAGARLAQRPVATGTGLLPAPVVAALPVVAAAAPSPAPMVAGLAPRPGLRRRDGAESGRPDRWRPALAASAALAATGALVAYWSSDRADGAYDRYLRSAGAGRREAALDRAERYDRISGAAFAAMEAGLLLTAYFLFY